MTRRDRLAVGGAARRVRGLIYFAASHADDPSAVEAALADALRALGDLDAEVHEVRGHLRRAA